MILGISIGGASWSIHQERVEGSIAFQKKENDETTLYKIDSNPANKDAILTVVPDDNAPSKSRVVSEQVSKDQPGTVNKVEEAVIKALTDLHKQLLAAGRFVEAIHVERVIADANKAALDKAS